MPSEDDDLETIDSPNDAADDSSESDTDTNDQDTGAPADGGDHDIEWYKKQNAKLFVRAKEAAGFVKDEASGKWVKPEKPADQSGNGGQQAAPANSGSGNDENFSQRDLIALIKADVHDDDLQDVRDYAKLKKISIKAALDSTFVKSMIKEKTELRSTSRATFTGAGRRGTGRPSDEALLENAAQGIIPESDADIRRLIKARKGIK